MPLDPAQALTVSETLDLPILADIEGGDPGGPNLEDDAEFSALERAGTGKPERQYGNTIIPAEDPEWKEVVEHGASLMSRTRDVRVIAPLTVAKLHLEGLPAFVEGLGQIRFLLEQRWELIHPRLDPEDGNDPMPRANALQVLAHPIRVLKLIRTLPIARSEKTHATVSWRTISQFTGSVELDKGEKAPTETEIRGVFAEAPRLRLEELLNAAKSGAAHAAAIDQIFIKVRSSVGPKLEELQKLLGEITRYMERFSPPPEVPVDVPVAEAAEDGAPDAEPVASAGPARPRAASLSTITSIETRADALRMLDLVVKYFQRNEPSSPLAPLLARAIRIAGMSFLDVLAELAPDGINQAKVVVQPREG